MGDRSDEQPRKIFLGGLSAATDEQSLRDFFGRFGDIDDCCVIRTSGPDQQKKSRGFGFVTFNAVACVDSVMSERSNGKLSIDGKEVEIKQAMSREDANENPSVTEKVYKVFIGGVGQLAEPQIRDYFSAFGAVKEVIVKNQEPGGDQKKRPYAFAIFEDHEVVDKIVVRKTHSINGTEVECKKATQRQGGQRGGGRGGGRNDNGYGGGGGGGGGRYQGGSGSYGGDGGSYGGGGDSYYGSGAKSGSQDSQGGGYGSSGSYGQSFGGGYGGSGGGYGGEYGASSGGGYGGSTGGYGGGYVGSGGGSYGSGGGGGGYGGSEAGGGNFGSGYGSQSSSYGPVRQQNSGGGGRYGAGGQSSSPYGNYGSGGYGSGSGGGAGGGGAAGGRRY